MNDERLAFEITPEMADEIENLLKNAKQNDPDKAVKIRDALKKMREQAATTKAIVIS